MSVVIPTFNRAGFVVKALESVVAQSYRDFEIHIVDDGSFDDTRATLTEYEAGAYGRPIHYVWTPNHGVAAARNFGIRRSGGEWIALLDSDDWWMPDKLAKQMRFLEDHPELRIAHTRERWVRNGVRVNPPASYAKHGGEVFLQCLPLCMIGPSTSIFHRSLFDEVGGFDTDYPVCEDYDFWLRVTSLHEVGLLYEELTWKRGGHADQLSTSQVGIDYWRIRALCRIRRIRNLNDVQIAGIDKEIGRKAKILLQGYRKHHRHDQHGEVVSMIRDALPDFEP